MKKIFLIIGFIFILTGILCNEWVLAILFSSDGKINLLSSRLLIWIFDLIMITIGITIITKRKNLNIKIFFYYFLLTILTIFAIEIILNIAYIVINPNNERELQEKPYLLPPFEEKEWAKTLFQERKEIKPVYKPFRMWGNEEYHGVYTNINSEGFRKTWNPQIFHEGDLKTIYIFGGSTTWSLGARDDYTVPSFISKKLYKKGYNFIVHNYGDFGYSNAQELITLILLLREGYRPDYVIFYDGINDVYNAYQGGVAGSLSNFFLISERLRKAEQLTNTGHILVVIKNILNKYSIMYREWRKIKKRIDPPESNFQEVAHFYSDDKLQKLCKDIIEYYSKSLKLLDDLSRIYGFKYICFWQPVAFTEDKMTNEESDIFDIRIRLQDRSLKKLFWCARDYLRQKSFPHVYDISNALRGRTKPYYWDWAHLTEEGNEVVANKIVEIFEKEFLLNE
jgi:lysophospholipase L1-like esterase